MSGHKEAASSKVGDGESEPSERRVLVCGVRVSRVYGVPQLATVWKMSECLWVVDGRGMLSPAIWDVSDAADVPLITKVYQEQFGDDFTLILRTRAEEIVSGGKMVLIIRGSTEADDNMWDFQLLGMTLMDMVSEVHEFSYKSMID
ncbi:hypothetical protein Dimus_016284 [Dionaea muscipula]